MGVAHRKSTVVLESIGNHLWTHCRYCNEHSVSISFSQIDSETKTGQKKVVYSRSES